jgi:hypothetical protein
MQRHLGHRERYQREIDARQFAAKHGVADHCAKRAADGSGYHQADPGADAELEIERGGDIGSGADEQSVAKRHLAGHSTEDIPGQRNRAVQRDQNEDVLAVDRQ